MSYLDWIKLLDQAQQYASMTDDKLIELDLGYATFERSGSWRHADVSAYVRAEIIGQNGNSGEHYQEQYNLQRVRCNSDRLWRKRETGYFVYCKTDGWKHSETAPSEVREFFK